MTLNSLYMSGTHEMNEDRNHGRLYEDSSYITDMLQKRPAFLASTIFPDVAGASFSDP
jgi:hypothetical protein